MREWPLFSRLFDFKAITTSAASGACRPPVERNTCQESFDSTSLHATLPFVNANKHIKPKSQKAFTMFIQLRSKARLVPWMTWKKAILCLQQDYPPAHEYAFRQGQNQLGICCKRCHFDPAICSAPWRQLQMIQVASFPFTRGIAW